MREDSRRSDIQLRPYRHEDAPETLAVFLAAVMQTAAADYTPRQIDAWAAPGRRDPVEWDRARSRQDSWVALIDQEIAGFGAMDAEGFIDMLFVSPEHGRKGVAGQLLAHFERIARSRNCPHLRADVSISARPFFEGHGFVVVAEQSPVANGLQLTNFRMEKSLTGP